jgi:hypothetical protein
VGCHGLILDGQPVHVGTQLGRRGLAVDAASRGYIKKSWYLIDIEARFELWRGGAGLATSPSVKVNGSVPVGVSRSAPAEPNHGSGKVRPASARALAYGISLVTPGPRPPGWRSLGRLSGFLNGRRQGAGCQQPESTGLHDSVRAPVRVQLGEKVPHVRPHRVHRH